VSVEGNGAPSGRATFRSSEPTPKRLPSAPVPAVPPKVSPIDMRPVLVKIEGNTAVVEPR